MKTNSEFATALLYLMQAWDAVYQFCDKDYNKAYAMFQALINEQEQKRGEL
jgi:hypothetical protein